MIVPSIDLRSGNAVQLVGGRELALDAGDPRPLAGTFGRVGEVAVVDLDAALGLGSNAAVIGELCTLAPCRVGGGIRDAATARAWLERGATKVVLGTAATPEVLRELPRERVIAALDCEHGEVVTHGWRTRTGADVCARLRELTPLVGGFLVTLVEHEGRLGGLARERIPALREAAGALPLTIAGGITSAEDVAFLDRLGCDAQVGMALYTGKLGLAEAFLAPVTRERADGLVPTVVVDELGLALGLAWSDVESLAEALATGRGVYRSRTRGLWQKGASSGDTQELLSVALDCDRDALRFTVRQAGRGFCHAGTWSCFGSDERLGALSRRLASRRATAPAGSYTARLLAEPELLAAKLVEEARELSAATGTDEVRHEAADLLFFTLVACARGGVSLAEVERELARRARRLVRRGGEAKAEVRP
jgi:phosphoribosyl-ATP pyrophosphohydrolase